MPVTLEQLDAWIQQIDNLDFQSGDDRRQLASYKAQRLELLAQREKQASAAPVASVAQLLATTAPFKDWLRSLPPGDEVAETWSCDTCPIATFLTAKGVVHPTVSRDCIIVDGKPNQFATPAWAKAFIYAIDGREVNHRKVIAAECLAALAVIEARAV